MKDHRDQDPRNSFWHRGCFLAAAFALALSGRAFAQFPAKVLFAADFAKGLPAEAQPFSGEWKATDGVLRQTDATATALLVLAKPQWNAPYTARVRVRLPNATLGAEAGLALQVRDAKNYVVFSLQRRKGATFAVLRIESSPGARMVADQAKLEIGPSEWHELRAEVSGPHFNCYLDGRLVVDYSFLGTPPPTHVEYKTWLDPSHGDVGLLSGRALAEFDDLEVSRQDNYSHMVTLHLPKRDAEGRLLPRQSFGETIRRHTEWMMSSRQVVDKTALPAVYESAEPYVLGNWVTPDDKLAYLEAGEFAFNHASFIFCAVRYYVFSGDERALQMARKVADWEIANSTPAGSAVPFLPPSIVSWQKDGTWKGMDWGLEPDKAAYLAMSFLKLAAATGDEKYKAAALRIAGTLRKLQQPDGSWPFRIDAKTAEVKSQYTESQLWYIQLFERLAALTGDKSFLVVRNRAFQWFMANTVKTNRWLGLYGDVASGVETYDQWIPMETMLYLLERRHEDPGYFKQAMAIFEWLNRTMVINPGFHPGVPGVVEQSRTRWVDSFIELRLGVVYARLWELTGNERYRDLAVAIGNSVTYCLMSDGKMRLGFYYTARSIPTIPITNDLYCEIMAAIPETAPRGENHILRSSSDVRRVVYRDRQVNYSTVGPSEDVLVVAGPVASLTAGGKRLPRLAGRGTAGDGWSFDPKTGTLRIRHQEADVVVTLEGRRETS